MNPLAVITGASRGIGFAAAERFLAEGWNVINISRSPCKLKGVVNQACDLSDLKQVEKTIEALNFNGRPRVTIVHNAAVTRTDTYATATSEDFMEVFRINVAVPQLMNRRLVPKLKEGSSVIFIGSTLSEVGARNSLSYTASKHALAGLMKATAQDLGGTGIHTCLICPGFTDTQMLKEVVGDEEARWAGIKGMILFGRLVQPAEIASLVYFCSTNPAINGSVLHANLGHR